MRIVPHFDWASATVLAMMLSGCFATAKPSGAIAGTALYGSAALPGALVSLAGRTIARSQVSSTSGAYLFADLPSGDFTLTVTSEQWSVEGAAALRVHVDQKLVSAPAVQLTPAGALSGTLTQTPAIDLTGAVVSAGALTALADANGAFDFGRVPAGHYAVTAVGPSRVTTAPVEVDVAVNQLTQVLVPLVTQQAPPPHINHAPQVGAIEVTSVSPPVSNPQLLLLAPDLPADETTPGGVLHFRCPASDPDGDPLTITWQVSGGLVSPAGADAIEWTAAASAATISCLASDGQGGLASAVRAVSVFDFRYIGAAISGATIAAARTNATQGSSDLFLQNRAGGAVTQLATSANESAPQLLGTRLAYLSDENATAENPLDVYLRSPPAAAPTRVTTTAGAEIFSLTATQIYVANGSTLTAYGSSATIVLPNGNGALEPGAIIDALVAGTQTVIFRQTSTTQSKWSGVRLSDGNLFDLTLDASASVAWNGTQYVAADPVSQQVIAFPDALPVVAGTLLAPLSRLSGTPFPSLAGDASGVAYANVDDSGLFTPIDFINAALAVAEPSSVLGVSGGAVLFSTPSRIGKLAATSLSLWVAP